MTTPVADPPKRKVLVAGDIVGNEAAAELRKSLIEMKFEVEELPCYDGKTYGEIAEMVGLWVASNSKHLAFLFCGTGMGVGIAANKVAGVRAALVYDRYTARKAITSNNANVITIGARRGDDRKYRPFGEILEWASIALDSKFDPEGPSAANVDAVDAVDERHRNVYGLTKMAMPKAAV